MSRTVAVTVLTLLATLGIAACGTARHGSTDVRLDASARAVVASYAPSGGFDFLFDPAAGRLSYRAPKRPVALNLDVYYVTGAQPPAWAGGQPPFFYSFNTGHDPHWNAPVVPCVPERWFVYAGPHQDGPDLWGPTIEVLAHGTAYYCPKPAA